MGYPTALDVFIIICFVTVFAALGIIHILRQQKDWVGWLKFVYSTVHTDKSKVEISQNCVAFSEYTNFTNN